MNAAVISSGELLGRPSSIVVHKSDMDDIVVSASTMENGDYVVVTRYGDTVWQLIGGTTNSRRNSKMINFNTVPDWYRSDIKAVFYRYMLKGREGSVKPAPSTIKQVFSSINKFLKWIQRSSVRNISEITSVHCINYARHCHDYRKPNGKALDQRSIKHLLDAVEALYELSQYSNTPIKQHPWPESSTLDLSGAKGAIAESKTPIIPDEDMVKLFQSSLNLVSQGNHYLDLLDNRDTLKELGWNKGFRKLQEKVTDLRTACYIVLAISSGCRNHELAYLKNNPLHPDPSKRHPWYSTVDEDGIQYWWMRSRSEKTYAGDTEWMINEKAVEALQIMERWAAPYQEHLEKEINERERLNPHDPELIEAKQHRNALFLGKSKLHGLTRTISNSVWNEHLRNFAKKYGINFTPKSHMFRRKFAVYAAKSPYGNLVYLRDHFKHWNLSMTSLYALNESQDLDLYDEILSAKEDVELKIVEHWLDQETMITGGAASKIKQYRRDTPELKVFETRKQMAEAISDHVHIRGAGHVWCINDTAGCKGQGLVDRTPCADCDNSVIDDTKKAVWHGIYEQQIELLNVDDIGHGAKERVNRDLARAKTVLNELGAGIE